MKLLEAFLVLCCHLQLIKGSGIPVRDLVLDALKIAVGRLSSQASLLAAEFSWLTVVHVENCSLCTVCKSVRLLHMIVTTHDRYDTCYQKQVSIACILLAWHTWHYLGGIQAGKIFSQS